MEYEDIKSSTAPKGKISKRFGNAIVDIDLKDDAEAALRYIQNGEFVTDADSSHYYKFNDESNSTDSSSNQYFVHRINPDMSEFEVQSYLQLKQIEEIQNQNEMMSTVKKIAIFFMVCQIISIIATVVLAFLFAANLMN